MKLGLGLGALHKADIELGLLFARDLLLCQTKTISLLLSRSSMQYSLRFFSMVCDLHQCAGNVPNLNDHRHLYVHPSSHSMGNRYVRS